LDFLGIGNAFELELAVSIGDRCGRLGGIAGEPDVLAMGGEPPS
jgi:hypothetical protein